MKKEKVTWPMDLFTDNDCQYGCEMDSDDVVFMLATYIRNFGQLVSKSYLKAIKNGKIKKGRNSRAIFIH